MQVRVFQRITAQGAERNRKRMISGRDRVAAVAFSEEAALGVGPVGGNFYDVAKDRPRQLSAGT